MDINIQFKKIQDFNLTNVEKNAQKSVENSIKASVANEVKSEEAKLNSFFGSWDSVKPAAQRNWKLYKL